MDKYAECGKCGGTDIRRYNIPATFSHTRGISYKCVGCGSVVNTAREYDVGAVSEVAQTAETKRRQAVVDEVLRAAAEPHPLSGCTDKALEEIATAAQLLAEHPETEGLLTPLNNELFRELTSRDLEKLKEKS